jgi:hypothetical protein
MKGTTLTTAVFALTALTGIAAATQATKSYRTRLSPLPITTAMASTIAGVGSVTAMLNGNKLTLNGTFEVLRSRATLAKVHRGKPGIRGPAILDLTVTPDANAGTSGKISGTLELTAQQISDLEQKWLYVQLYSERAPEGNLWGWLFPQEKGR